MKRHKISSQAIIVESYVTLRSEWPDQLSRMVSMEYNARGFRVVDGRTEWQYFSEEIEAKKWAEAVHHLYSRKQEKDCESCGYLTKDNKCTNDRCVDFLHNS